jgi:hypothetical protein
MKSRSEEKMRKDQKIEEQARQATAKFNDQTGSPLTAEELANRPAYPYVQKLFFIPKVSNQELKEAKKVGLTRPPIFIDYPFQEKPLRLFSYLREPTLPVFPSHDHVICFIEDYAHDWNIHKGRLHYSSRFFHEGGVWILLEFNSEPTLKA